MIWAVTLSKHEYEVIAWSRSSSAVAPEALVALRTFSHKCQCQPFFPETSYVAKIVGKLLEGALYTEQSGAVLWCSPCCGPTASFCPVMKLCWKVLSLSHVLTNQATNWLFLLLLLHLQARIFLLMHFMLTKTSDPTNTSSGMTLQLINSEIHF